MKKILLLAAIVFTANLVHAQQDNLIRYSNSSPVFIDASDAISNVLPYPNPTSGALHIELDKAAEVYIYNANGQLVIHQRLQRGKYTIDLSAQPTGLYFMNLIANDNSGVENHRINKF